MKSLHEKINIEKITDFKITDDKDQYVILNEYQARRVMNYLKDRLEPEKLEK